MDNAYSPCGAYRLLATIFGLDAESLLARKGLIRPAQARRCRSCGVEIETEGHHLYCPVCRNIPIACESCGAITYRHRTDILNPQKLRQRHQFCNKHCFGVWLGKRRKGKQKMRLANDESLRCHICHWVHAPYLPCPQWPVVEDLDDGDPG